MKFIFKNENIEIDLGGNLSIVEEVIKKFFPDIRKIISEFQRYAIQNGKIDVGILSAIQDISVKELINILKTKNFPAMRKWVNENLDNDPTFIIRMLFDSLENYLEPSSIPQAIIILSEYGFKSAFVADQEINMSAMLINIMADCIFK
jgi:replication factor C small subunit